MRTLPGPGGSTAPARVLTIFSLSGTNPSVIEYWSATCPYFAKTFRLAVSISARGKSSGAGNPPAKEITSGREVIFRISRIAELFSSPTLFAKLTLPPSCQCLEKSVQFHA